MLLSCAEVTVKKARNFVVLCLFTYPAGIVIALVFLLLWTVRILKVKGWVRNFPHFHKRVVLICNHEYKGEQFLCTALFFIRYIFWPFAGPFTIADEGNYKKWYYFFISPRLVFINREKVNGDSKGLVQAKRILKQGGSTIWFPEGGRTSKGRHFRKSKLRGKMIRVPWKGGFVSLVTEPGATLVVAWFDYRHFWDMSFVVAPPRVYTPGTPRDEIIERSQELMLELADEATSTQT